MSQSSLSDSQAIFLEEFNELIQEIERDLLLLEERPGDAGLVNSLFRHLHTIKGGAGMVGMDDLARYAHAMENLLDLVRTGRLAVSQDLASLLFASIDCLKGFLGQATGEGSLDVAAVSESHRAILAVAAGEPLPRYAPAGAAGEPLSSAAPAGVVFDLDAPDEEEAATLPADVAREAQAGAGPGPVADAAPGAAVSGAAVPGEAPDGPLAGQAHAGEAIPAAAGPDQRITPEALSTYLIRFFIKAGAAPEAEAAQRLEAAFANLGDVLAVSHVHAFPPPETADPDAYHLWRTFHLTTGSDQILVESVAGDANFHNRVEMDRLDATPHEPHNQAQIDAMAGKPLQESAAASRPEPFFPATPPPPASGDGAPQGQAAQKLASIRVDTGKLDGLVTLVSEMITAAAGLDRFHDALEHRDPDLATELKSLLDDKSRVLRELQDHALNMRMIPIGMVFESMNRLVRDYCRQSGKRARLVISGQDTEVDKKVSEQLSGPLKHLIRNSLDHGVESPEARLAQGKPETGELRLNAYQQFGMIVIEVQDDGKGIDTAKVVASAKAKGLVAPQREFTKREALELIFMPALSTAEAVTEVSGRGVGMDVVKRDIEALRGLVEIATEPGKGTCVTVSIPLTLAIIDGLLVRVGESYFVAPRSHAQEHLECPPGDINAGPSNFLQNRDELIPLLALRDLFSIPGEPPPDQKVLVATTGKRRVGLVVDQLVGYQQTVIKSLSPLHKDVRCFSGATILGDGRVALILDVAHLTELGQIQAERARNANTGTPS